MVRKKLAVGDATMAQDGFSIFRDRYASLDARSTRLSRLMPSLPVGGSFRPALEAGLAQAGCGSQVPRRGASSMDAVLDVSKDRCVLTARFTNLSDEKIEYQVQRPVFLYALLGLGLGTGWPDDKTALALPRCAGKRRARWRIVRDVRASNHFVRAPTTILAGFSGR